MDFARKSDALWLLIFTSVEITLPDFGLSCKGKNGRQRLARSFFPSKTSKLP